MGANVPHQHRRHLQRRVVLRAACLVLLALLLLTPGSAAAKKKKSSSSKTCKASSGGKDGSCAKTATNASAGAAPAPSSSSAEAGADAAAAAAGRRASAKRAAAVAAAADAAPAQQQQQQEQQDQEAYLKELREVAEVLAPPKSAADRGSYIDFLLLVSEADQVPSFQDSHFNPVVVPVMPPHASGRARQQLGPAADMMALLAKHRAQFLLSVGNATHFDFLKQLPGQYRATWFHLLEPQHVNKHTVETFYWRAIRLPPGGPPAEPLLSVFTPAHKSGAKIKAPYWSLLDQTYSNWEWIVFDDSPPGDDATWRELSALRDADPRVQVFRTDRNDGFIGSVKAQACAQASGQLLVELDHDDELMPDALQLLKEALVANPDAGFFYTEAVELKEGSYDSVDYGADWAYGQGLHYRLLLDGRWVTASIAPPLNDRTLRYIVGVPNHVRAWRRDAYLALGGHNRALPVADDYDLVLRSLFAHPAVYVRHMAYLQYRDPKGDSFTFKRNELIQRLTRLTSAAHDDAIHALLAGRNMSDGGPAATWNYTKIQYDAEPTGPHLARLFHKPTADAAAAPGPARPHVTVVLPTFNNTRGLKRAVKSVLAQDYPHWELLIVGDACPKLDGFMEKNIKLFTGTNHTVRYYNLHERGGGGLYAPLNAAAKALVASDWMAYIKDTARWAPDHLSSLVDVLAEDPRRAYVFASLQMNKQALLADDPRRYRLDTSAMMHHRRLIEQYGGWRSQKEVGPANDWQLFGRWKDEPWGATLKPTAILPDLGEGMVQWLQNQYM